MNTVTNPRSAFPSFYENRAIRVLAGICRWTVSGHLGDDNKSRGKAPIDIRHLIDRGRVRGAFEITSTCLVTLGELTLELPEAANHAFYLQSNTDGLMVIDIEPGCPPEIAQNLLALPGILYSETSMSGRGYHLLSRLPKNLHGFPVAAEKRVLREENGHYELLLDHWVTFTRRPVSEYVMQCAQRTDLDAAPFGSIDDLYASLAQNARPTVSVSAIGVHTGEDSPEIRGDAEVVARTVEGAAQRLKSPEDFDHDLSRYEFSVLGSLHGEMHKHLVRVGFLRRAEYSDGDRAWLLFKAALEVLPARPKHDELRNGRPFLLDRAAAMIALSADDLASDRITTERNAA